MRGARGKEGGRQTLSGAPPPPANLPPDSASISAGSRCSANRVQDDQHDYCAADRDEDAVQVETADTLAAQRTHDKAADHGADDAEHDVEQETFTAAVDDQTGNKAGDQPEHDPSQNGHEVFLQTR